MTKPLDHTLEKIRLDTWLWAARFYKTRSLAKEAIEGGKVHLNGQRCKPGKELRIGDSIRLRTGWDERTVEVAALFGKRQKAPLAQQLYRETGESIALREQMAQARKACPKRPEHKPNKKERRQIRQLKSDPG